MTNNPSLLTVGEKLKASLYYSVSKICRTTGADNTIVGSYTFNKDALELISEIIFKKLEIYAEDLEAFAKKRKQATINVEDVKLLFRRNPQLKESLTKFIDDTAAQKNEKKKKKGKSISKKDQPCSSKDNVIELD